MKSIEWAAGLFEGEGCLSKVKDRPNYSLKLTMTDLDVVQDFADIFGLPVCGPYYKGKYKPVYQVNLKSMSKVYKIVEQMLPYLGTRRSYKALNCLDEIDNHNYTKGN